MWKFNLIVLIIIFVTTVHCSIINEHIKRTRNQNENVSQKYSIEDLLTKTFPYADSRVENQYDMDPCKAGRQKKNLYEENFPRTFFIIRIRIHCQIMSTHKTCILII